MYTGLKVLIIEDRRENIVFLANNILKPKGFEVITAMDGETGLRKALEHKPDIIITDLKLPRMHGLDILADLQDRGSTIPAIVMTFHGSEETAIKAFRLGAKDYLIKPFQVDDVEAALERAVAAVRGHSGGKSEKILQQQIQALQEKTGKLNELLAHQTKLTTEARNSAKAMVQFIRSQQREVIQQRREVETLTKQLRILSQHLARLTSRLDAQARQFHIPTPNS